MKTLHPIRSYRNFKARVHSNVEAVCVFCLAAWDAIRSLNNAIKAYDLRVAELHEDIKKIEASVGFLYRAERYQRETNGHKANF